MSERTIIADKLEAVTRELDEFKSQEELQVIQKADLQELEKFRNKIKT